MASWHEDIDWGSEKLTKTMARNWLRRVREAVVLAEKEIKAGDWNALLDSAMEIGGSGGELEHLIRVSGKADDD